MHDLIKYAGICLSIHNRSADADEYRSVLSSQDFQFWFAVHQGIAAWQHVFEFV